MVSKMSASEQNIMNIRMKLYSVQHTFGFESEDSGTNYGEEVVFEGVVNMYQFLVMLQVLAIFLLIFLCRVCLIEERLFQFAA